MVWIQCEFVYKVFDFKLLKIELSFEWKIDSVRATKEEMSQFSVIYTRYGVLKVLFRF